MFEGSSISSRAPIQQSPSTRVNATVTEICPTLVSIFYTKRSQCWREYARSQEQRQSSHHLASVDDDEVEFSSSFRATSASNEHNLSSRTQPAYKSALVRYLESLSVSASTNRSQLLSHGLFSGVSGADEPPRPNEGPIARKRRHLAESLKGKLGYKGKHSSDVGLSIQQCADMDDNGPSTGALLSGECPCLVLSGLAASRPNLLQVACFPRFSRDMRRAFWEAPVCVNGVAVPLSSDAVRPPPISSSTIFLTADLVRAAGVTPVDLRALMVACGVSRLPGDDEGKGSSFSSPSSQDRRGGQLPPSVEGLIQYLCGGEGTSGGGTTPTSEYCVALLCSYQIRESGGASTAVATGITWSLLCQMAITSVPASKHSVPASSQIYYRNLVEVEKLKILFDTQQERDRWMRLLHAAGVGGNAPTYDETVTPQPALTPPPLRPFISPSNANQSANTPDRQSHGTLALSSSSRGPTRTNSVGPDLGQGGRITPAEWEEGASQKGGFHLVKSGSSGGGGTASDLADRASSSGAADRTQMSSLAASFTQGRHMDMGHHDVAPSLVVQSAVAMKGSIGSKGYNPRGVYLHSSGEISYGHQLPDERVANQPIQDASDDMGPTDPLTRRILDVLGISDPVSTQRGGDSGFADLGGRILQSLTTVSDHQQAEDGGTTPCAPPKTLPSDPTMKRVTLCPFAVLRRPDSSVRDQLASTLTSRLGNQTGGAAQPLFFWSSGADTSRAFPCTLTGERRGKETEGEGDTGHRQLASDDEGDDDADGGGDCLAVGNVLFRPSEMRIDVLRYEGADRYLTKDPSTGAFTHAESTPTAPFLVPLSDLQRTDLAAWLAMVGLSEMGSDNSPPPATGGGAGVSYATSALTLAASSRFNMIDPTISPRDIHQSYQGVVGPAVGGSGVTCMAVKTIPLPICDPRDGLKLRFDSPDMYRRFEGLILRILENLGNAQLMVQATSLDAVPIKEMLRFSRGGGGSQTSVPQLIGIAPACGGEEGDGGGSPSPSLEILAASDALFARGPLSSTLRLGLRGVSSVGACLVGCVSKVEPPPVHLQLLAPFAVATSETATAWTLRMERAAAAGVVAERGGPTFFPGLHCCLPLERLRRWWAAREVATLSSALLWAQQQACTSVRVTLQMLGGGAPLDQIPAPGYMPLGEPELVSRIAAMAIQRTTAAESGAGSHISRGGGFPIIPLSWFVQDVAFESRADLNVFASQGDGGHVIDVALRGIVCSPLDGPHCAESQRAFSPSPDNDGESPVEEGMVTDGALFAIAPIRQLTQQSLGLLPPSVRALVMLYRFYFASQLAEGIAAIRQEKAEIHHRDALRRSYLHDQWVDDAKMRSSRGVRPCPWDVYLAVHDFNGGDGCEVPVFSELQHQQPDWRSTPLPPEEQTADPLRLAYRLADTLQGQPPPSTFEWGGLGFTFKPTATQLIMAGPSEEMPNGDCSGEATGEEDPVASVHMQCPPPSPSPLTPSPYLPLGTIHRVQSALRSLSLGCCPQLEGALRLLAAIPLGWGLHDGDSHHCSDVPPCSSDRPLGSISSLASIATVLVAWFPLVEALRAAAAGKPSGSHHAPTSQYDFLSPHDFSWMAEEVDRCRMGLWQFAEVDGAPSAPWSISKILAEQENFLARLRCRAKAQRMLANHRQHILKRCGFAVVSPHAIFSLDQEVVNPELVDAQRLITDFDRLRANASGIKLPDSNDCTPSSLSKKGSPTVLDIIKPYLSDHHLQVLAAISTFFEGDPRLSDRHDCCLGITDVTSRLLAAMSDASRGSSTSWEINNGKTFGISYEECKGRLDVAAELAHLLRDLCLTPPPGHNACLLQRFASEPLLGPAVGHRADYALRLWGFVRDRLQKRLQMILFLEANPRHPRTATTFPSTCRGGVGLFLSGDEEVPSGAALMLQSPTVPFSPSLAPIDFFDAATAAPSSDELLPRRTLLQLASDTIHGGTRHGSVEDALIYLESHLSVSPAAAPPATKLLPTRNNWTRMCGLAGALCVAMKCFRLQFDVFDESVLVTTRVEASLRAVLQWLSLNHPEEGG